MKIVCISDTHNLHTNLELPRGDVLVHAGDFTGTGTLKQVLSFINWFEAQPFQHKVLIAGNHEVTLDTKFYEQSWYNFHNKKIPAVCALKENILQRKGIHYLEHSHVYIEGVKFFGSPYQPTYCNWAFNLERGSESKAYWSKIPYDTDVLITHGPPKGFGDVTDALESVGCEELLARVQEVQPKAHIFGHIHEGYGKYTSTNTIFVNASSCDSKYKCVNTPIIVEI